MRRLLPDRSYWILRLVILLGVSGATAAQAASGCPTPQSVGVSANVRVEMSVPQPSYSYSVGRNDLTQMMSRYNNGTRHGTTLGLTVSRYTAPRAPYKYKSIPNDRIYCQYVSEISIQLQLEYLKVYVAKEYPHGSCQANVILTHENEHVRVHQAAVRQYAPIMREQLQKALRHGIPSASQGSEAINALVEPVIQSVLAQMTAEQRRGNGYIDTQDSYARTGHLCRKW